MVQRLRGGGRCGCEMANEGFNRMERHAPILCNYPACLAVSRVGAAPVAEGSGRLSICMPQHCLLLLASIAVSLGQQSAAPPTTPSPPPAPRPNPNLSCTSLSGPKGTPGSKRRLQGTSGSEREWPAHPEICPSAIVPDMGCSSAGAQLA